jgi:isopenicillin N synthase-like dioxygenase
MFVGKEDMEKSKIADRSFPHIPIIDISPLVHRTSERTMVAAQIATACRDSGFFYIVGHCVDEQLQLRLERISRQFFAQDIGAKLEISMDRGGRAWRGYFPVGGELTSGKTDIKEGIYFGAELGPEDPMVKAGVPLHGPNLFPPNIPLFRKTVLDYMAAMTELGHTLMSGIALSLGLDESYFYDHCTSDPLALFRIFNYPPGTSAVGLKGEWGVGEHTDYGLLTILKQDESGGLQVKSKSGWVDAVPVPGSFVCNIGDMLERMTGGLYISTPHRVENRSGHDRLSFPFFFDPNFDAEVRAIDGIDTGAASGDWEERWDGASVHEFQGTYGEYLLNKVSKVFPGLQRKVL